MAKVDRLRLASEVTRAREGKGMTKRALAESLGLSWPGSVSRWESGDRAVSGDALADLERTLDVRVMLLSKREREAVGKLRRAAASGEKLGQAG